jgi:hypothetical protein
VGLACRSGSRPATPTCYSSLLLVYYIVRVLRPVGSCQSIPVAVTDLTTTVIGLAQKTPTYFTI